MVYHTHSMDLHHLLLIGSSGHRQSAKAKISLHRDIFPISPLTLVLLNKLRCHAHFQFSANQVTCQIVVINLHT